MLCFSNKILRAIGLAAVLGIAATAPAKAAFVTLNEAGMDTIFSQASFGNTPIDIMYGAVTQVVAPHLLNLDTGAKWNEIRSHHVGGANEVTFYYLDSLSWCGNVNVNYIGCGELPGNDFVVESVWAAGPNGASLLAHELGHNLNLGHVGNCGDVTNLMNPCINANDTLTAGQVQTIFNSPLVQGNSKDGFFIKINPVLIVDRLDVIPLPAGGLLLLGGLGAFGLVRRRKS